MTSRLAAAIGVLPVLFTLLVGPAWSQDAGLYLGGTLGQAEHQTGCAGVTTVSCDQKDSSWKLFAGYQFNRYFAAELGYADLGESSGSGVDAGVNVTASAEVTAWEAIGVGSFPLTDRFSLYGKLGVYRAETEIRRTAVLASTPGFSLEAVASEKNTDLTFGIGAKYEITRNLAVRAEWQRYPDVGGSDVGNESDIDLLGVGLTVRF